MPRLETKDMRCEVKSKFVLVVLVAACATLVASSALAIAPSPCPPGIRGPEGGFCPGQGPGSTGGGSTHSVAHFAGLDGAAPAPVHHDPLAGIWEAFESFFAALRTR